MSYPKFTVGLGSDSVFKMFSPTLGVALTDGCFMSEGIIVPSEGGMRDATETDFIPSYADAYTEELVAQARGSVKPQRL